MQAPGERSYHIFYQLVRGASPQERERLCLPSQPEAFRYLAAGECTAINGIDDAAQFGVVRQSMVAVGVSAESQVRPAPG